MSEWAQRDAIVIAGSSVEGDVALLAEVQSDEWRDALRW